jgi:hypothetical protein
MRGIGLSWVGVLDGYIRVEIMGLSEGLEVEGRCEIVGI